MKKFILTLMLGASALGFSQNITYSLNSTTRADHLDDILTIGDDSYKVVGDLVQTLTASFTVWAEDTNYEAVALNSYYLHHYPSGESNLYPISSAVEASGSRNVQYYRAGRELSIGGRKIIEDGDTEIKFELQGVVLVDTASRNVLTTELGSWLSNQQVESIIYHTTGESRPTFQFTFTYRGSSRIYTNDCTCTVTDLQRLDEGTLVVARHGGGGLIRVPNQRTPISIDISDDGRSFLLNNTQRLEEGVTYEIRML